MIRGLYTSALGMTVQMDRMNVVTNNIANADTTGFKRDIAVTQSFSQELMKRLDDPGQYVNKHDVPVGKVSLGVFVDTVHTDFQRGTLRATSSPLDMALDEDGYFAISVQNKNGGADIRYTRDGGFTLDADGYLRTKEGNYVQGANGDIVLPEGEITMSGNGAILVNGEYVDTVRTTAFGDNQSLRKIGDNLYKTTDESAEKSYAGHVLSAYLENSNANSVREMVDMVNISRIYETNQRMVTIHDSTLQRAVNDIGRK